MLAKCRTDILKKSAERSAFQVQRVMRRRLIERTMGSPHELGFSKAGDRKGVV
jgi:hypothetical protein